MIIRTIGFCLLTVTVVACSPIGPDYVRPKTDLTDTWKSTKDSSPIVWQSTNPQDSDTKQDWWVIFNDPTLNDLEKRCIDKNYTLQAALAQIDQAKAQYGIQAAAFYPTVQLDGMAERARVSANRPFINYLPSNASLAQNYFTPYITASYEFDWIGQIRRSVESAQDTVEQARANEENTKLILTAQVAQTYFLILQLDEETQAMSDSLVLQEKVLTLISKKHNLGASSEMDLVQQAALVESTKSKIEQLRATRIQLEDSLGTLVGEPANTFKLAYGRLPDTIPSAPISLPSTLLERRPDIAASERAMAAANAQIGVAKSAYFPLLTLSPTYGGYLSSSATNLVSVPSLIWSFGLMLGQTLFDGGRISSGVDYANATYQQSLNNYRQTVLNGIQDAQDALGKLQQLNIARVNEDKSLANLNRAYELSYIRYRQGLDSAQTIALIQENQLTQVRTQAQVKGSQFTTTVGLIKALGGIWISAADAIPSSPGTAQQQVPSPQ